MGEGGTGDVGSRFSWTPLEKAVSGPLLGAAAWAIAGSGNASQLRPFAADSIDGKVWVDPPHSFFLRW